MYVDDGGSTTGLDGIVMESFIIIYSGKIVKNNTSVCVCYILTIEKHALIKPREIYIYVKYNKYYNTCIIYYCRLKKNNNNILRRCTGNYTGRSGGELKKQKTKKGIMTVPLHLSLSLYHRVL